MVEKIVDEDWKKRAQQEKEALSGKHAAKPAAAGASATHPGFLSLLQQTAMQALYHLGMVDDGSGMGRPPSFEHARASIEQLESLEVKTKGNLSREEQQALADTLQDVRMAFVEMTKRAGAVPPFAEASGGPS